MLEIVEMGTDPGQGGLCGEISDNFPGGVVQETKGFAQALWQSTQFSHETGTEASSLMWC